MTPAGIEPATFRFVAQHLNHCVTGLPRYADVIKYKGKCTIRHVVTEGMISVYVSAKGRGPILYLRRIFQAFAQEYFDGNVKFSMT